MSVSINKKSLLSIFFSVLMVIFGSLFVYGDFLSGRFCSFPFHSVIFIFSFSFSLHFLLPRLFCAGFGSIWNVGSKIDGLWGRSEGVMACGYGEGCVIYSMVAAELNLIVHLITDSFPFSLV